MDSPYYSLVPKGLKENLRFRKEMMRAGQSDRETAAELWAMCSRDLLFYINGFVWTHTPLLTDTPLLPFITYPFQDDGFSTLHDAIGKEDRLIEKSRDMGASWMCVTVMEWFWHFRPMQAFLLVSRNEKYVDNGGDPKALMFKIDFIHKHLPGWLMPSMTRKVLHFENNDNGSTIDGESTTGDVARGARLTAILMDEFAAVERDHEALESTQAATKCRLFNSTPKGSGNAFYDMAHKPGMKKLRFHWSQHPDKNRGLYQADEFGIVRVLDTSYRFADDYPFVLDGKLRSPWYDNECDRAPNAQLIAQELDIDYKGSDFQFFDSKLLDRICRETVVPPYVCGELDYDTATGKRPEFTPIANGRLRLWIYPDGRGRVPTDRNYVVGCDIATGTGASNSVLTVGDCKTGEKVAEFVESNMRPDELACMALALCNWFECADEVGAYLVWESNGPGRVFGSKIIELGYRNFYYRQNERTLTKGATDLPGWEASTDSKRVLYSEYQSALKDGRFINRSEPAVAECREYVYLRGSDTIEHSRRRRTEDPSGARDNHGDRVTADALCWRGMKKRIHVEEQKKEVVVPQNCLEGRRRARIREQLEETLSWT